MAETVDRCTCRECEDDAAGETATLHAGLNLMVATLDEKNARVFERRIANMPT